MVTKVGLELRLTISVYELYGRNLFKHTYGLLRKNNKLVLDVYCLDHGNGKKLLPLVSCFGGNGAVVYNEIKDELKELKKHTKNPRLTMNDIKPAWRKMKTLDDVIKAMSRDVTDIISNLEKKANKITGPVVVNGSLV
jgi:hypothetical protein